MNEHLDTKEETQIVLTVEECKPGAPAIELAADAVELVAPAVELVAPAVEPVAPSSSSVRPDKLSAPIARFLVLLADNVIAAAIWAFSLVAAGTTMVMPSVLTLIVRLLPVQTAEAKWHSYLLVSQALWIRWVEIVAGLRFALLDAPHISTDSTWARIATLTFAALLGHVITNRQLPPILRCIWLVAIISSTALWVPVPIFLYAVLFVRFKIPGGKTPMANIPGTILGRLSGTSSIALNEKLVGDNASAGIVVFGLLLPLYLLIWKLIEVPDLLTAVLVPATVYFLFCQWNHWRWHKELSRLLAGEQDTVWREVPVKLHRTEAIIWIKGSPERYYIRYASRSHAKMPSELRHRHDDSPGVMQVCFRRSDKKPVAIKLVSGIFPLTRSSLRPA